MSRATAVVGMQMVLDKKDKEIAKLKARVGKLEAALTIIRYAEAFLGTGDCMTAAEIAADALEQEAGE